LSCTLHVGTLWGIIPWIWNDTEKIIVAPAQG